MRYVYILTNEAMPDLIKIGCTTRTAEERTRTLYNKGTTSIFGSCFAGETSRSERKGHSHLGTDCKPAG